MDKKYFHNFILCLIIIGFLTGCGYRFSSYRQFDNYQTISVPYVDGDKTGGLTSALIREISNSGFLCYQDNGADVLLKVKVIDYCSENVGFAYDRDKEGEPTDSLIPSETRIFLNVEVCIIDNCNRNQLLKPFIMSTYVDFDHDYYFSRKGVNSFSLGQLTDYDAAYDAAHTPLNQKLAEKIINYITNYW